MQIKHDVKGQLARLLATEDLIVEHRSVDTASFNVQTRVLTLPTCLLYTSPSPRDVEESRMPSSA